MPKVFSVYILANSEGHLYIGVTSRLRERLWQHRTGATPGYASKHRIHRLVYVEQSTDARAALAREKQLKGWTRQRKLALIRALNPTWKDLGSGL